MSPKVKRVSCTMLKEMIEQDKPIEDYDINDLHLLRKKVRMRQKPDTMMTWFQHLFSLLGHQHNRILKI